jgi:hypothetical protein
MMELFYNFRIQIAIIVSIGHVEILLHHPFLRVSGFNGNSAAWGILFGGDEFNADNVQMGVDELFQQLNRPGCDSFIPVPPIHKIADFANMTELRVKPDSGRSDMDTIGHNGKIKLAAGFAKQLGFPEKIFFFFECGRFRRKVCEVRIRENFDVSPGI